MLTILTCEFGGELDQVALVHQVGLWLDNSPNEIFIFVDSHVNRIGLQAELANGASHLDILGPSSVEYVNPDVLKRRLSEKARQHTGLREAGHAYVLAIWLEDWLFSEEEVVEAWFGKRQVDLDSDTKQVVGQWLDGSGLHFGGSEIQHKTVSGTLVFRARYNPDETRHALDAWYIQNPVASSPIPADLFPVRASFVVLPPTGPRLSMGWRVIRPNSL